MLSPEVSSQWAATGGHSFERPGIRRAREKGLRARLAEKCHFSSQRITEILVRKRLEPFVSLVEESMYTPEQLRNESLFPPATAFKIEEVITTMKKKKMKTR